MNAAFARRLSGTVISLALLGVTALNSGCQHKADGGVPSSSSVTEISTPPAYSPSAAPIQPVYDTAPMAATPIATSYASAGSMSMASSGPYVVKKGDTLYGIARTHYGSGKEWQKIVAANPGLSPSSLKVGQTINVP